MVRADKDHLKSRRSGKVEKKTTEGVLPFVWMTISTMQAITRMLGLQLNSVLRTAVVWVKLQYISSGMHVYQELVQLQAICDSRNALGSVTGAHYL